MAGTPHGTPLRLRYNAGVPSTPLNAATAAAGGAGRAPPAGATASPSPARRGRARAPAGALPSDLAASAGAVSADEGFSSPPRRRARLVSRAGKRRKVCFAQAEAAPAASAQGLEQDQGGALSGAGQRQGAAETDAEGPRSTGWETRVGHIDTLFARGAELLEGRELTGSVFGNVTRSKRVDSEAHGRAGASSGPGAASKQALVIAERMHRNRARLLEGDYCDAMFARGADLLEGRQPTGSVFGAVARAPGRSAAPAGAAGRGPARVGSALALAGRMARARSRGPCA